MGDVRGDGMSHDQIGIAPHPAADGQKGGGGRTRARLRSAVHPRRAFAWAVLAPAIGTLAWSVGRPSTPWHAMLVMAFAMIGAATLANYVPTVGTRVALGCTRCAVAAGLSVPVALVILASQPRTAAQAAVALLVTGAGLTQRMRQPDSCPT